MKLHVFGGSPTSPNDANTLLLVAKHHGGPRDDGGPAGPVGRGDGQLPGPREQPRHRALRPGPRRLDGDAGVAGNGFALGTLGATPIIIGTNNADRIHILANGNIGMGQPAPVHPLQMASGAHVTAGGVWTSVSSREAKDDVRSLTADEARTTLAALEPVKFAYKADPTERHVGFVAEDVPDLVAQKDRKTLSPMDIVAVLTRVVQEQQQRIEELTAKLAALEAARPR